MMARLSPLPPEDLDGDALALYRDMAATMEQNQPGVVSRTADGALLGPFDPMLRFPRFGRGAWEYTKLFMRSYALPEPVRQVAILAVGARMDARFELYSHEIVAEASGLSGVQVAALAAGQRPPGLTDDQAIALAVARVLVEGRQLPGSTYRAAVAGRLRRSRSRRAGVPRRQLPAACGGHQRLRPPGPGSGRSAARRPGRSGDATDRPGPT